MYSGYSVTSVKYKLRSSAAGTFAISIGGNPKLTYINFNGSNGWVTSASLNVSANTDYEIEVKGNENLNEGTSTISNAFTPSSTTNYNSKTVNFSATSVAAPYVTYNANGGSVSPTGKTVYKGSTYGTLPTPTRSGYQFLGWSGGNKNLLDINATLGTVDNTAYDLNSPRKFTPNTRVVGMAYDNYLAGANVSSLTISNNTVRIVASSGYGVGYPLILDAGKTYTLSGNASTNGGTSPSPHLGVVFYTSTGTKISYEYVKDSTSMVLTFTVPSNAYYTVIVLSNGGANADITYSNVQLEYGSSKTAYEAFAYTTASTTVTKSAYHTLYAVWKDITSPTITLITKWTYVSGFPVANETVHDTGITVSADRTQIQWTGNGVTYCLAYNTNGGRWWFDGQGYTSTASSYLTPNGGIYASNGYVNYYNVAVPDTNSGYSYIGNGYAAVFPLNTWTYFSNTTGWGSYGYGIDTTSTCFSVDGGYGSAPVSIKDFKFWGDNMHGAFYNVNAYINDNEYLYMYKYIAGNQSVDTCLSNGSNFTAAVFEDSEHHSLNLGVTITQNNTYTVCAMDAAGNKVSQTFIIDKVGKISPRYPLSSSNNIPYHISELFFTPDGYNQYNIRKGVFTHDFGNYSYDTFTSGTTGANMYSSFFMTYANQDTNSATYGLHSNGRAIIKPGSNTLTLKGGSGWKVIEFFGGYGSGNVSLTNFKLNFSDGKSYTIRNAVSYGYISPFIIYTNYQDVYPDNGQVLTANPLSEVITGSFNGLYPIVYLYIKVMPGKSISTITFDSNSEWSAAGQDGVKVLALPSVFDFSLEPFESRYWTDNWNGNYYARGSMPSSTSVDGTTIGWGHLSMRTVESGRHEACIRAVDNVLNYTNTVFCISSNYWDTDAVTTGDKMKKDLIKAFGNSTGNTFTCTGTSNKATCKNSNNIFACTANSDGSVSCSYQYSTNNWRNCVVMADGRGRCY